MSNSEKFDCASPQNSKVQTAIVQNTAYQYLTILIACAFCNYLHHSLYFQLRRSDRQACFTRQHWLLPTKLCKSCSKAPTEKHHDSVIKDNTITQKKTHQGLLIKQYRQPYVWHSQLFSDCLCTTLPNLCDKWKAGFGFPSCVTWHRQQTIRVCIAIFSVEEHWAEMLCQVYCFGNQQR